MKKFANPNVGEVVEAYYCKLLNIPNSSWEKLLAEAKCLRFFSQPWIAHGWKLLSFTFSQLFSTLKGSWKELVDYSIVYSITQSHRNDPEIVTSLISKLELSLDWLPYFLTPGKIQSWAPFGTAMVNRNLCRLWKFHREWTAVFFSFA